VPGLTHEQLLATASLYEKHGGSCLQAARELGISRTTFATRVEIAITKGYITSKIEAVRSENDGPVEIKKVFLKPQYNIYQRENTSDVNCRVLAIGDSHDGPDIPDKSRFTAMGAYARINNIEQVVQIGDFCSMDSMSTHDPNWTLKGHEKPSFKDDVNSFREALVAFDEGLAGHNATKHVTLGNHEDRIGRFVNNNPEVAELLFEKIYELLSDFGWNYSPFGAFHFVGDVGFTHVPLNQMGKPYGGMHSENAIARDSLHDVVYGHTHKRVDKSFPKIGQDHITVVNLGCSLPDGHIEEYAKHSVTGWSYGVYDLSIQNGRIKERTWIPMDVLMNEYN